MSIKARLKIGYVFIDKRVPLLGYLIWAAYRKLTYYRPRLISGKNNQIIKRGAVLNSVKFDIKGDNNIIEIGTRSVLNNVTFYIRGDNHRIVIGENCQFRKGSLIWLEDYNCELHIGQKTTFQNVHIAITEPGSKVMIGNDCLFAYDIDIRTGDSHSIIDSVTSKRVNYAENITIGNHVWLAAHSVVLKGVEIADNSVVATGAIITKPSTESNVVLAGNPAKVVKTGVSWTRNRTYH